MSFPKQQELNRDALVALLDKIGPAILLTHSQSGAFSWPVADARPNLVKALVAVEPSGPPVHDVENTGARDWFKDAERTKLSGLSDVPLSYEPPLAAGAALDVVRHGTGESPHPLLRHDNVIITPHIGGATHETLLRGARMIADAIEAFAADRHPSGVINGPEVELR